MNQFTNAFGSFEILPLHHHSKSPLQAWNAADELILHHLAELKLATPKALLVNDEHGALATALDPWQPTLWSDSYCSKLSTQNNLERNRKSWRADSWIPASQAPQDDTGSTQSYDLVLIKIPKSLTFLKYQLAEIRKVCGPKTIIIAAAMVKHLSSNMIQAFENAIGPTKTSLAKKKARLVFSELDSDLKTETLTKDTSYQYELLDTGIQLYNFANVFSQQKLDIGTRFLLENFPHVESCRRIIDLGCGNGALGIYAASKSKDAQITFCDDSYLALESAAQSFKASGLLNNCEFVATDGLDNQEGFHSKELNADLILCNPPFHQGNNVESQTAQRMFSAARRALGPSGRLIVVGNRHLGYHQILKRYFKKVSFTTSNKKFVVLEAQ